MYNFVITYKTGEIVQYEINRTELIGYVEFFSKLNTIERIVIERCGNNEQEKSNN